MTSLPLTSLPVMTSLPATSFPVTSLPVAHLSQIMMVYRSSKQSSTDQTPNMPPPQYSQSNDEEPYYILIYDNAVRPVICEGWHFTHTWKTLTSPHHFTKAVGVGP